MSRQEAITEAVRRVIDPPTLWFFEYQDKMLGKINISQNQLLLIRSEFAKIMREAA